MRLEKKSCFKNAMVAFLTLEEFRRGWYAEGFAIPDLNGLRLPLEHGWIALPDGGVIDVTYADLGHRNVEYFPAIRLSWEHAMGLVSKDAAMPYMLR